MSYKSTTAALKKFAAFPSGIREDCVRVYVEAANDFTAEELDEHTSTFVKYDRNLSGDLDVFELNRMYEERGETKTNRELNELIASIGAEFGESLKKDGVTYKAYLSVMIKDKKGLTKTEWGSFARIAKKHDANKSTGKIANVFEQKAASANSEEARIKADIELRKANAALKREEAERKAKKQEALKKFAANIHGESSSSSSSSSNDQ